MKQRSGPSDLRISRSWPLKRLLILSFTAVSAAWYLFRMPPKLSIITISYKDPAGLARTLASLKSLDPEALSWEHVVVDQSPDENNHCFSTLKDNWPLRRIQAAPLGIYGAHNRGIAESTGEVLWFLNGGDALSSKLNLLEAINSLLGARDSAVLVSPVQVSKNGEIQYTRRIVEDLWKNIRGENKICHQAMLIRKSLFDEIGNYHKEFRIAADYEHLYRILVAKKSITWFPKSFSDFDMGGTSSNVVKAFDEFRAIQKRFSKQLGLRRNLENFLYFYAYRFFTLAAKWVGRSRLRPILEPQWKAWKSRG